MPTLAQARYLLEHQHVIKEPILIIGSKIYDYDRFNFHTELLQRGYKELVGIDLNSGENVDYQVDICNRDSTFFNQYAGQFCTLICMSVLMHVPNPFLAAENITKLSAPGAVLLLSEPFIHKVTNMPTDFWRFTPQAFQMIFPQFTFNKDEFRMAITRSDVMHPYNPNSAALLRDIRHPDETKVGFFVRRLHRKLLSKDLFRISRLFPEIAIFATGIKQQ